MTDETNGPGTETGTETGSEDTSVLGDWQHPEEPPTQEPTWAYDSGAPDDLDGEQHRGFHPLQTGYLVAGLLALGVAVTWLLADRDAIQLGDGSAAFSVVLVAAGAVGLVASLGRALRRH